MKKTVFVHIPEISVRAMLGRGNKIEEAMISAGTKFIISTIGHYSIGDRRFTAKLFNAMRNSALEERDKT